MPETVRMALARCCQRQTNVTVQEKKVSWSLPLDKGHFITEGLSVKSGVRAIFQTERYLH